MIEQKPTGQPQPSKIEKSPFSGIFFEVDVLLEAAKDGCIARLQPLTTREPGPHELFASIQVNESQDFGINYNTFSKSDDPKEKYTVPNYEAYGLETVIPKLQEHIESYVRNLDEKKTEISDSQGQAFSKSMEKRLLAFFTDCWKKAGGDTAKTPTYFSFEDDFKFIDMTTGKSMSENQILKTLKDR